MPENERTCANCGCSQEIKHPTEIGVSQLVCRKNGLFISQAPGHAPRLTYPPTDAKAVCFNDWRPIGTKPGDKWRQEALSKVLRSVFVEAAKMANMPPSVAAALECALGDSDLMLQAMEIPHNSEKN